MSFITSSTRTLANGSDGSAQPGTSVPVVSSSPTFERSHRTMSEDSASTPSLALASGTTRFGSPDGQQNFPFGPGAAPASHSALPVESAAQTTSATSGPSGSGSSASVVLSRSLESRLRVLLDSRGSMLFRLTWKERVTPSGRRICALRASVLRTSDSAYSSWVSPIQNDSTLSEYAYSRGDHGKIVLKLPGQALLASWATPMARDFRDGRASEATMQRNARPLNEQATMLLGPWATPAAKEAGGTVEQFLARKAKAVANGAQMGISLTSLSLQATLVDSGPMPSGSSAETAKPGRLNPAHSLWLMGIPVEWLWCAPENRPAPRFRKRTGTTGEGR